MQVWAFYAIQLSPQLTRLPWKSQSTTPPRHSPVQAIPVHRPSRLLRQKQRPLGNRADAVTTIVGAEVYASPMRSPDSVPGMAADGALAS